MTGIYAVRVRGMDGYMTRMRRVPVWRAWVSGRRWMAPSRCSRRMCSTFRGSLYGRELEVEFVAKIRDEQKFATLDAWCSRCIAMRPRLDRFCEGLNSSGGLQGDDQSARDGLPDEGRSRATRAGDAGGMGGARTFTRRSARSRVAGPASCCTTDRLTRTARSTSATPSTRCSRTSWSNPSTLDGFDSPYVPGWDCHGLPIELQVEKKLGRPGQKLEPRSSARRAASTRRSRWNCSARISNGSACSATGIIPICTHGSALRSAADPRARQDHRATDTYIRVPSRCTGASTAARRWPRPKSSTRTRLRRRSTWTFALSIPPTSSSASARRRCGRRVSYRDLDDDALDAARQRGCGAAREFRYVLVEGSDATARRELLVLAASCATACLERYGLTNGRRSRNSRGARSKA